MKATAFTILLSLLAGTLFRCGRTEKRFDAKSVLNSSVCAVAQDPKAFDGKVVKLNASALSDGLERTVLIDSRCEDAGIALVPGAEKPDPTVGDLTAAIVGYRPGVAPKEISASFTGLFIWRPHHVPERSMELLSVSNLRVRPKT